MSKGNITEMRKFLHRMFERTIGLNRIYEIEIDYLNETDVESNIHKKKSDAKTQTFTKIFMMKTLK